MKIIQILALVVVLLVPSMSFAAVDASVQRMEEIKAQLEDYRDEYNRLKNIGYGGATLRFDLDKLGRKVAALVKELEEIGKELDKGAKLKEAMAFATIKWGTLDEAKSVKLMEQMYLMYTVLNLSKDSHVTLSLKAYDQETGKKISLKNLRLDRRDTMVKNTPLAIMAIPIKWNREQNVRFECTVKPKDGSEPLPLSPVTVAFVDNSEPMAIHLPAQMEQSELYPVSYDLPEGFVPPFEVRMVYRAIEGYRYNEGSTQCEGYNQIISTGNDPEDEGKVFVPSLSFPYDKFDCDQFKDLPNLPDEVYGELAGRARLTMRVIDANGRKAKGEALMTVVPFKPVIQSMYFVGDDDEDEIEQARKRLSFVKSGQNVSARAYVDVSLGDKSRYFAKTAAYNADTGQRLYSHSVELADRDDEDLFVSVRYDNPHWFAATNVRVDMWLEDGAGSKVAEMSKSLRVRHDRMTIAGPGTIMSHEKVPFSFKVPAHFGRPLRWVKLETPNKHTVSVWNNDSTGNKKYVLGDSGTMFSFVEGTPASGSFTIGVADPKGHVAIGTKKVHVKLNPKVERGVFDDIGDFLDGVGEALTIVGEVAADPEGPLAQYVNSGGFQPGGGGGGFGNILDDYDDDEGEDDWPPKGASGSGGKSGGGSSAGGMPGWIRPLFNGPPTCSASQGAVQKQSKSFSGKQVNRTYWGGSGTLEKITAECSSRGYSVETSYLKGARTPYITHAAKGGNSAAIRLTPNGRVLYISVRYPDGTYYYLPSGPANTDRQYRQWLSEWEQTEINLVNARNRGRQ